MVTWKLVFAKHAQKDAKKLASTRLKPKAEELLAVLAVDPFQNPPPYEKLVGDLAGAYSRRISIQPRLVYEVLQRSALCEFFECGHTMNEQANPSIEPEATENVIASGSCQTLSCFKKQQD